MYVGCCQERSIENSKHKHFVEKTQKAKENKGMQVCMRVRSTNQLLVLLPSHSYRRFTVL